MTCDRRYYGVIDSIASTASDNGSNTHHLSALDASVFSAIRIVMTGLYLPQFESDYDHPAGDTPFRDLIIGFTPRCGSHMIGHTLHATGRFGSPFEYFNHGNLAEWKRRLGTHTPLETLRELRLRRTSRNGVFATKLHWLHFPAVGGFQGIDDVFVRPFFLYVHREDVVAQAVSYAIAKQTGVYISGQQGTGAEPVYSFEAVLWCLDRIQEQHSKWLTYLRTSQFPYWIISYESFLNGPAEIVTRLAELMELDFQSSQSLQPPTRQQRSEINREWAKRFATDWQKRMDPTHAPPRKRRSFFSFLRRLNRRLLNSR